MTYRPIILTATGLALLAGPMALAQSKPADQPVTAPKDEKADKQDDGIDEAGRTAGRIVTQPARDVGIAKTTIPDVLAEATQDPYNQRRVKTCRQIAAELTKLNEALGPDFTPGPHAGENRVGKLAEAGGKTVVNSIIPFRSLIREVSGAAPAQRRYERAIDAGFARRGFLRGVHRTRGCKTSF